MMVPFETNDNAFQFAYILKTIFSISTVDRDVVGLTNFWQTLFPNNVPPMTGLYNLHSDNVVMVPNKSITMLTLLSLSSACDFFIESILFLKVGNSSSYAALHKCDALQPGLES